jgi:hypothetical protein
MMISLGDIQIPAKSRPLHIRMRRREKAAFLGAFFAVFDLNATAYPDTALTAAG